MILDKLVLLRDILNERLPFIDRWDKVGIYFDNDAAPQDTIDDFSPHPNSFYILWSSPKRKENPNPYEYKCVPLSIDDLNAVIKRQREKLRVESETL